MTIDPDTVLELVTKRGTDEEQILERAMLRGDPVCFPAENWPGAPILQQKERLWWRIQSRSEEPSGIRWRMTPNNQRIRNAKTAR